MPVQAFTTSFSALQRAENSSTVAAGLDTRTALRRFSALQRAENSSTETERNGRDGGDQVSVLFSEPKIPQLVDEMMSRRHCLGFSALQRAENSSTFVPANPPSSNRAFQCSSASRKFLNQFGVWRRHCVCREFQCSSASRKFLNEPNSSTMHYRLIEFQCSSASRKFLNFRRSLWTTERITSFSALQRAENSSTRAQDRNTCTR